MGVGHADLVPAGAATFENPEAGPWFAALLAMRLYGGYHYNLGRETFLVPVTWEYDWPVFALGEGKVPSIVTVPTPRDADPAAAPDDVTWPFKFGLIPPSDPRWSAVRDFPNAVATPDGDAWRLPIGTTPFSSTGAPSFVGVRQSHQNCQIRAEIDLTELVSGNWAGLAIRQSEADAAAFAASPIPGQPGEYHCLISLLEKGTLKLVNSKNVHTKGNKLTFILDIKGQNYYCRVATESGELIDVGVVDGRTLDTATAGGFLGLWIGLYAISTNKKSAEPAAITAKFYYDPLPL
jgi:alpha-N-arabinofuranosidase